MTVLEPQTKGRRKASENHPTSIVQDSSTWTTRTNFLWKGQGQYDFRVIQGSLHTYNRYVSILILYVYIYIYIEIYIYIYLYVYMYLFFTVAINIARTIFAIDGIAYVGRIAIAVISIFAATSTVISIATITTVLRL